MIETVNEGQQMETSNRIVSEDDLDNGRCAVGDYVRLKHGLAVVTRTADMTDHGHIELFILLTKHCEHEEWLDDYEEDEEIAPPDVTLN